MSQQDTVKQEGASLGAKFTAEVIKGGLSGPLPTFPDIYTPAWAAACHLRSWYGDLAQHSADVDSSITKSAILGQAVMVLDAARQKPSLLLGTPALKLIAAVRDDHTKSDLEKAVLDELITEVAAL